MSCWWFLRSSMLVSQSNLSEIVSLKEISRKSIRIITFSFIHWFVLCEFQTTPKLIQSYKMELRFSSNSVAPPPLKKKKKKRKRTISIFPSWVVLSRATGSCENTKQFTVPPRAAFCSFPAGGWPSNAIHINRRLLHAAGTTRKQLDGEPLMEHTATATRSLAPPDRTSPKRNRYLHAAMRVYITYLRVRPLLRAIGILTLYGRSIRRVPLFCLIFFLRAIAVKYGMEACFSQLFSTWLKFNTDLFAYVDVVALRRHDIYLFIYKITLRPIGVMHEVCTRAWYRTQKKNKSEPLFFTERYLKREAFSRRTRLEVRNPNYFYGVGMVQ